MPALTGKQRRHLRALGHEKRVLVQIGKGGIDAGLIAAVDQALTDHELVKVKCTDAANLDRHEAAEQLASATKSDVAQVLGKIFLLFRSRPENPQITLP